MADSLYTVEQCASKAGCSPKTIRRQILAGKLKATRIGVLVRIAPADWEEYLNSCRYVATGRDGRSESNMPDAASVARWLPVLTRSSSKRHGDAVSTILELDGFRRTRSAKR